MHSLTSLAYNILMIADPVVKAEKSREIAQNWQHNLITDIGKTIQIKRPMRPNKPELRPASKMPKRTTGHSPQNRIALLHALAHIELNAIDLAWDIIARFTDFSGGMPHSFFDDWVKVADEEAKHFLLLEKRLNELGATYGDLPAHDGLWESAERTKNHFAARLAIVPMVLEARGLDVTPKMIQSLKQNDDKESARILQIIHDDEIGHVAFGKKWFDYVAQYEEKNPQNYWQDLVHEYFTGKLLRPFNKPSRDKADFPSCWYEPLAS